MATLKKRLADLEQHRYGGHPIYVVVNTVGKSEDVVQAEIDAAYERLGKGVIIFTVRRE